MPLLAPRKLLLSLALTPALSLPAFAELPPASLWQSWQDLAKQQEQSISAKTTRQDGTAVVLEDLSFTLQTLGRKIEGHLTELRLESAAEGVVVKLPDDFELHLTNRPLSDGDEISARLRIESKDLSFIIREQSALFAASNSQITFIEYALKAPQSLIHVQDFTINGEAQSFSTTVQLQDYEAQWGLRSAAELNVQELSATLGIKTVQIEGMGDVMSAESYEFVGEGDDMVMETIPPVPIPTTSLARFDDVRASGTLNAQGRVLPKLLSVETYADLATSSQLSVTWAESDYTVSSTAPGETTASFRHLSKDGQINGLTASGNWQWQMDLGAGQFFSDPAWPEGEKPSAPSITREVSHERLNFGFTLPLNYESDDPQLRLSAGIDGVDLPAEAWARLDPQSTLEHKEKGSFALRTQIGLRALSTETEAAQSTDLLGFGIPTPELETTAITLEQLTWAFGDAHLSGDGKFTFDPPIGPNADAFEPEGELSFTLSNMEPLLTLLGENEEFQDLAMTIAMGLAMGFVEGPGPGQMQSHLSMSKDDGVLLNGAPLEDMFGGSMEVEMDLEEEPSTEEEIEGEVEEESTSEAPKTGGFIEGLHNKDAPKEGGFIGGLKNQGSSNSGGFGGNR